MMSKFISLLFSSKNPLPNTKVFWGRSYEKTSDGLIDLLRNEDDPSKAEITLMDRSRNEKKTELQVFHHATLMKMPDYLLAVEDKKTENLVNTWRTKKNKKTIFKVAGETELAFSYTSPNDVETDLARISVLRLREIDYFNEVSFCKFLETQLKLSIDQLRMISGMDKSRIHFLLKNSSGFESLIKNGLTIEQLGIMSQESLQLLMAHIKELKQLIQHGVTSSQIATIDYPALKKAFDLSYYWRNALKFISIQQVLGLDAKPLSLEKIQNQKNNIYDHMSPLGGKVLFSIGVGRTEFGEYVIHAESTSTTKTVKIIHKKHKEVFSASAGTLKDEAIQEFEEMIKDMPPILLIHEWFIVSHEEGRILYCPSSKNIIQEKQEAKAPKQVLDFAKSRFDFYKELQFIEFLAEKGCPIEELRTLPGMSYYKFKLLFENLLTMEKLLSEGIKIKDFAL
ncbi:MAG TPA: hypothetical protein VHM20_07995, partial [Gammaproteobacteria bacterium]|nr:hypothetical protein [Gammaproteobacteria bacterium]